MVIHFTQMQVKNPNFFYTFDLNDNGQLRTVFWIHPRSRLASTYFSDVLTFDSTYLINTYQMPFYPLSELTIMGSPHCLVVHCYQMRRLRHLNGYSNHGWMQMVVNHLMPS